MTLELPLLFVIHSVYPKLQGRKDHSVQTNRDVDNKAQHCLHRGVPTDDLKHSNRMPKGPCTQIGFAFSL